MNERATRWVAVLAFSCFGAGCTVTHVPPPEAPAATMPDLEDPLPAETDGFARVVIATDVPARVERGGERIALRRRETMRRELLCTSTPCNVTLPYGDHELLFRGLDDRARVGSAVVAVRKPTVVVNHTLGEQRLNLLQPFGGFLVVTGLVLIGIAGGMAAGANDQHRKLPSQAWPLAATGFATSLLGGVVIAVSPSRLQEGRTTQWSPAPGPLVGATVTAGMKF